MSLNKIMIIGNLGRDPEMSYTQGGQPVCRLAVATTRKWTNKQTNQLEEETTWHRVTVWGASAEACNNHLLKGRQVYVEGRLKTSSYEQDGVKKYSTEIVAENVVFLGGREDGQGGGGQSQSEGHRQQGGGPAPYDPGDYNHEADGQ